MVRNLERSDLSPSSRLEKSSTIEVRNIARSKNKINLNDFNEIQLFMCDCDQWGGGDPPCDDCKS